MLHRVTIRRPFLFLRLFPPQINADGTNLFTRFGSGITGAFRIAVSHDGTKPLLVLGRSDERTDHPTKIGRIIVQEQ